MMLLLKGIIVGFSIAAPVGPIGILCIRRTLNQGRLYGLISGLGAATADVIYGCIAAFGLTIITQFLLDKRLWIQLIGGLFLFYLGIQSLRSSPTNQLDTGLTKGLLRTYSTTFLLTITNPMTILSFMGIFAGLGFSVVSDISSGYLLVTGVFLGSVIWWLLLSNVLISFRHLLDSKLLVWVNKVSGLVLIVYGAFAILWR